MARWVNETRSAQGLSRLGVETNLTGIARDWSAHMAAAGGLSHQNLQTARARLGVRAIRENVGFASDSARRVYDNFLASPIHYNNIVATNVTTVGVGCVFDDRGWWVTQIFVG